MGDVSNWILTLSSFITEISVEYLWWSYCCVLLPGYFFHTHSHTLKILNAFLILWQIFSNSFVLHDRQKLFRQALCDIFPARKRLGRPPTTISVRVYYLHKLVPFRYGQRYDAA